MEKKVVLITGSSRGIGASTALKFAKEGYDVVINYKDSYSEAEKIKDEVVKYGSDTLTIQADMSNEEDINNMVNKVIERYGHIDVLVNNAGIAIDTTIEDKTKDNFMKILDVNLVGPFLLSRACAKYMPKGSSIIMVSSTNGLDTYYPYSIDYDASKAGLISLMHNLAVSYAPDIRVNAVCPGWVMTDMNKCLDDEYIASECSNILLNRFATPDEIANAIYFLGSHEASYINNTIIRVDGGIKC